jgi:uncharacterized protein with FMN-binding domain
VGSDALAERLERLAQRRPGSAAPAVSPPPRRVRRHPAQAARYVAVGLSAASTLGLTSFFALRPSAAAQQIGTASVVAPSTPAPASTPTSTPSSGPASTAVSGGAPTVVDGATFSNRWGDVQVEATFAADGSLASVTALQTPDGEGKSVRINDAAVPVLAEEAVSAQSAQVDTVSGATYTSTSYRQSLQSAIDAARAAGATQLS